MQAYYALFLRRLYMTDALVPPSVKNALAAQFPADDTRLFVWEQGSDAPEPLRRLVANSSGVEPRSSTAGGCCASKFARSSATGTRTHCVPTGTA